MMQGKAKLRKKPRTTARAKQRVNPIPPGYHAVTPYLSIRGAAQAIDFYRKAFGAREVMRMPGPNGRLGDAEIEIGRSRVMLADEFEARSFLGPQSRGGTTVHILEDPCGHIWHVATHKEDVSMAELKRRSAQKAKQG